MSTAAAPAASHSYQPSEPQRPGDHATMQVSKPAIPTALSILTVLTGLAATIVAIVRLIASPGTTAWLVLGGALGLLTGGWWSMATEEVRGMPLPDVEVRPAP